MQIIILNDAEAVAKLSANRIVELINKKDNVVLGLATGSTPIAMYQQLIKQYENGQVSFKAVTSFNLDEYIGLDNNSPQSYRSFMTKELFTHIDIDTVNTHLPSCRLDENPRFAGSHYEKKINAIGGIDLQILGIGSNGHIGFNEPTSSLSSRTRVKTLTQTTVKDNGRLFAEGEYQPHLAITMGIGTIMDSRQVILLATGESKAQAVADAIEGSITSMCPASALQLHERATFILDSAAAKELKHTEYYDWVEHENKPLMEKYGHFYEVEDV